MVDVKKIRLKYITDKNGKRTEVILSVKDFEKLLEDLDDLASVVNRINEPTVPHDEVIKQLKRRQF